MERAPTKRTRSGSGRVKLEEVAQKASVSTATVSRVFNEPSKVSEEVKQRVIEAARTLNWIPNAAGRALASSRTQILGAIIPTLDNEIFANQISGMQSVFSHQGFTLFLGCSNYDPNEGLRQTRAMLVRGVEAISIVGEDHPDELFDALLSRNVPYVVTYGFNKLSPHPCVGFDNYAAFREIVEYLLSLGHRKFAAIFQPVANNDRVEARLKAVRDTLALAGLSMDDGQCLIGASTMEFGATSFLKLMHDRERPTAIVCGNDNIALGALLAAKEAGLSAPGDFSITGFDDLAISSRMTPNLTTMRVDNQEIGIRAAHELLSAISGTRAVPKSYEVMPTLIVRNSTGVLSR